jgi:hypothetical protein
MSPHDATDTAPGRGAPTSRQLGLALLVIATAQLMLALRRGAPRSPVRHRPGRYHSCALTLGAVQQTRR